MEKKQSIAMVDVGEKNVTRRRAVASGRITMGREAFERLVEKKTPKGDVLPQAEVAGILAAKRTSELLPLCHPLPLDSVRVWFELGDSFIDAFCEAIASARTGVEMEALVGVNAALLAVYDLTKAMDPALWISDVHLVVKEGGKSGVWTHPRGGTAKAPSRPEPGPAITTSLSLHGLKAAVVTVSDRVSAGLAEDRSGPEAERLLSERGVKLDRRVVVPDERPRIAAVVKELAAANLDLVILTGGTGLSPRDVTPEAIEDVCDRVIPGIGEALRADGSRHSPMAGLSRSLGAQLGRTLIIALPGSPKAVVEGFSALAPVLSHAVHISRGGDHTK